jgi:predicted NBD/HSP70 family sugar kinase
MHRSVRRGSKNLLRDINNSRVLGVIQSRAPVSRAEIARLAGLPPPTITSIVGNFIEAGLVRETTLPSEESNGSPTLGRRPIGLELNERAAFMVGVKVRRDGMTVAVTDLSGRLERHTDHNHQSHAPDEVLAEVASTARAAVADSGIDSSSILGIGVGMPGLIDHARGICRYSPLLGWGSVDVARILEEHCTWRVYVDNDVNMVTAAQMALGAGKGLHYVLAVTIGEGVGLGIAINGEIYRGAAGGAGEFGHTKVRSDLPCECGKNGCLEAVVSERGIVAQVEAAGRHVRGVDDAIELARGGDAKVRKVFKEAGAVLGESVGNLLNLFNPELIIITGEGVRIGEMLLGPMQRAIKATAFGLLPSDSRIAIEQLGDEAWAQGAASMVVHELLRPPIYESRVPDPLAHLLGRATGVSANSARRSSSRGAVSASMIAAETRSQ